MKTWQIVVVTILYAWMAVDLYRMGRTNPLLTPDALMFAGYALSNIGIIWGLYLRMK